MVEATAHRWQSASTLSVQPMAAPEAAPFEIPVEITVDRGGIFGGNIVLALLLILLWPAALIVLHWQYETRRRAPLS